MKQKHDRQLSAAALDDFCRDAGSFLRRGHTLSECFAAMAAQATGAGEERLYLALRTGVRETEDAYYLDAEMPGFEQNEIELSVKSGMLTIDAEHKEQEGTQGENRYGFSERTFHRSFSLDGIDDTAISAEYKNGVLSVKLPKVHPAEPETRRIEIH